MVFKRINPSGMVFTIQGDDSQSFTNIRYGNKEIVVNTSISSISQCWYDWTMRNILIQDAFPSLKPEEREFLMTGIDAVEWKELFGDEDGMGNNKEEIH